MTDDFEEAGKKFNLRKLVIVDTLSQDYSISQIWRHFKDNPDVTMVFMDSYSGLLKQLTSLIPKGEQFNRVLFETHGHAGVFYAGSTAVGPSLVKRDFAKYATLFPFHTRIYFSGCDIAADHDEFSDPTVKDAGFKFMKVFGETLLRMGRGEVLAYDGEGLTMMNYMLFVGIHFTGRRTSSRRCISSRE